MVTPERVGVGVGLDVDEQDHLAEVDRELLSFMPGMGPPTGWRIRAGLGDGTPFEDGDKPASDAGVAPVTRQSGCSLNGEPQSRRGNHRLKSAMFLAGSASLRSPDSKAIDDRKPGDSQRPHLQNPEFGPPTYCLARHTTSPRP